MAAMPGLVFEPKVAKSVVTFMAADSPDKVRRGGGAAHMHLLMISFSHAHAPTYALAHARIHMHAPIHSAQRRCWCTDVASSMQLLHVIVFGVACWE